ncbi:MAG: hypothetical protein WCE54_09875 [Ignavibacteriaceae bacterium]
MFLNAEKNNENLYAAINNIYVIGKSEYEHFKKYTVAYHSSSYSVSSNSSVFSVLRQRNNDERWNDWRD